MANKTKDSNNRDGCSRSHDLTGYAPHPGDRFEKDPYDYKCPLTGETRHSKGRLCVVDKVDQEDVYYTIEGHQSSCDIDEFVRLANRTVQNGAVLLRHNTEDSHAK